MANNGRLSVKKRNAVRALLVCSTVGEAASVADVGERTLRRWLSEDTDFQEAVADAEKDAIGGTVRRLVGLQTKSLDAIETILDDAEAAHGVKLRAASIVLDSVMRLRELFTLEERILRLEQNQNETA